MTNVTFKNVKTNIEINETDLHILFRAMKDYKNKVKVVADEFPVHFANLTHRGRERSVLLLAPASLGLRRPVFRAADCGLDLLHSLLNDSFIFRRRHSWKMMYHNTGDRRSESGLLLLLLVLLLLLLLLLRQDGLLQELLMLLEDLRLCVVDAR